ncbi:MAG TPA: carbamoyltransferase C-terminal domain-containing protein [Terriglobales bacterium]|nr:carbamoyltransferase C-terminal domain-containing protein [Terriglobales bacterium]
MRILGLSSFRHDTSAALLEDGQITAAIENDKLVRTRTRGIPEAAIRFCFKTAAVSWETVDVIAVATNPLRAWLRRSALRARLAAMAPLSSAYYEANELSALARGLNDRRVLHKHARGRENKIVSFDEHLCHAASAFFPSGFERALIVVLDEDGDGNSGTVALGEKGELRVLRSVRFPHSLAWLYSQVTDLAGFIPHQEEHKAQWLSLEGEPTFKPVFLKMLRASSAPEPKLDYSYFNRGLAKRLAFSDKFYRETGLSPDPTKLSEDERKALTRSIQDACCEIICDLVEHFCKAEKVSEICFGGGLFQNSLLVAALERNLGFERVFVPAAPGNAGTALGAAYLGWKKCGQTMQNLKPFNVYSGPRYSSQEIKDVLDNCKARYILQTTEERRVDAAAELLQAGRIIGWFQGAAEFGSRALGNRSVLASPWAPYVKENLNDFIKHREWFRPFAISVPAEDFPHYFEGSRQCHVMNSLAWVRSGINCLPGEFLLPNGQVRLHIVDKQANPQFWLLLKRFGEHAPAPMLLNTSFNLFGEPLVLSPRDAVRSYFCSGLDALIIHNFVLSKAATRLAFSEARVSQRAGAKV